MSSWDDDDLFAISDDDEVLPAARPSSSSNPIKEHLQKQYTDIEERINAAASEIEEVKATTAHISNVLEQRALHGKDVASGTDSDLYTVEGQPVLKAKRFRGVCNVDKKLELVAQWQCILHDKWILGVELQNRSQCTLDNPNYYSYVRDATEVCGVSMFWQLQNGRFWNKIESVLPGAVHVVATTVLDLPTFDRESVVDCWGTISYKIDDTPFQMPVPLVQLSAVETIDSSCIKLLDENEHSAILCLKSTSSVESVVNVCFSSAGDSRDGSERKQLFRFLIERAFEKVHGDVFVVKTHGTLMYCLVEVLSIDADQASIRIFARSVNQLNIILHLLQAEFSNLNIMKKIDSCVEAAMALIRELEIIREKKSVLEIQEAKMITDLFIP